MSSWILSAVLPRIVIDLQESQMYNRKNCSIFSETVYKLLRYLVSATLTMTFNVKKLLFRVSARFEYHLFSQPCTMRTRGGVTRVRD